MARSDYYKLDYIQSNYYNAIDSGYFCTSKTKIEARYAWVGTTPQGRLFGVNDGNNNSNIAYYLAGSTTPGVLSYRYGSRGYISIRNTNPYEDRTYVANTNQHTIVINPSSVQYDGTTTATFSNTYSGTCANTLTIFGQNWYDSNEQWIVRTGAVKLYWLNIYDNNVIKRQFIPCKRYSDNKYGLYDLVEDKFYTALTSSPHSKTLYLTNYANTTVTPQGNFSGGSTSSATLTLETQTGGSVSGGGAKTVCVDSKIYWTAEALPQPGFMFIGWYSDSNRTQLVSTDKSYSGSSSGNYTLYAKFMSYKQLKRKICG